MALTIQKLSVNDGMDIYKMLQQLPADENGFQNSAAGKSFDEYKEWLKRCASDSERAGIVDGWKVPSTTYWLYEDGAPVGF